MPRRYHSIWLAAVCLLAGCKPRKDGLPRGFKPDIGPWVHQTGRPTVGAGDSMPLGETRFNAEVRPEVYAEAGKVPTGPFNDRPEFYSIEVDLRFENQWIVCFSREFVASEIPASVLQAKVRDIVSFDPGRRLVTFNLGTAVHTYTLPATP